MYERNPAAYSASHDDMVPRVLIVDLSKYYGGADVRVLELARSLEARGYSYAVAVLAGSPLHQQLLTENLTVLPVPFSRGNPLSAAFLMRAIRRHRFQVIDAHNSQSQTWAWTAALFARSVKAICTVHSAYRVEHNGSFKGWLYEQVLRLNAIRGTRFIAVSEAVDGYLQNIGISNQKISLIHNSIRFPESRDRTCRSALLQSFGWDPASFVVTVVARLEPVKGHSVLLNALKLASIEYPELHCLIVGEGRLRRALLTQMRQLQLEDRVQFTGFRNDVSELLAASDAFCLPSFSEGLPYALLEAIADRLPLLVSNVGGMGALLTHQKNAILVPPSNPPALASGLAWMIEHHSEAATLAEAAFRLIQERFSCDAMINETVKVYREPMTEKADPQLVPSTQSKAEV